MHTDHVAEVLVQPLTSLVNSEVRMGQVVAARVQCLDGVLIGGGDH